MKIKKVSVNTHDMQLKEPYAIAGHVHESIKNTFIRIEDDDGNKKELECNERYYVPSEISWLLKTLGYTKIEIFGAKLGAFSRNDKLTTEDFEMLVVALIL